MVIRVSHAVGAGSTLDVWSRDPNIGLLRLYVWISSRAVVLKAKGNSVVNFIVIN